MASAELISSAKMKKRIVTNSFDAEVERLLDAALLDLGCAGVEIPEEMGPLVEQAAITYFLVHFGTPDEYDRLKSSYDEQKAQLATRTGYTDWGPNYG